MTRETPQYGVSRSETSWSTGASSNAALAGTQQQHRHHSVHHEAAKATTEDMTHNAHLMIVHKHRSSMNTTHHAMATEYTHITVNGR